MIDKERYWDHRWLSQNKRIKLHPNAAYAIAGRYRDFKFGRRLAVCAASTNTPLWQSAVEECYGYKSI